MSKSNLLQYTPIIFVGLFFNSFINSCVTQNKIAPRGTVQISDSLFIDRYPVSNFDYLLFLASVEKYWSPETSDSLSSLKPYGLKGRDVRIESNTWGVYLEYGVDSRDKKAHYDLYSSSFYGQPDSSFYYSMFLPNASIYKDISTYDYLLARKYNNYPVVYISLQQAKAYCKWRTDMERINDALNYKDSNSYYKKNYGIKKYRVPYAKEWKMAYHKYGYDFEDSLIQTFVNDKSEDIPFHNMFYYILYYDYKLPAYSFQIFPNSISEFLLDGVINYNWTDKKNRDIDSVIQVIGVSPGIGFRCSCEIESINDQ